MLYFPLSPRTNQIRLLVLYPGNEDDEINCSLIHHDTQYSEQPKYEALSYTWGGPHDTSPITIKGQAFQVTRNLKAALRRLRKPPPLAGDNATTNNRYFWVDAVCIAQTDDRERGEQVLRMRQIYGTADRTIVWLGEGTAESDQAMDFMNQYRDQAFSMDSSLVRARSHREQFLSLVEGVLIRQWWFRVWIVQEVLVSSRLVVVCGSKTVEWQTLLAFIDIVNRYHAPAVSQVLRSHRDAEVPNSNLGAVLDSLRRDWQKNGSQPFAILLVEFRNWKSTRPIDKIYAVLGLAAEAENPALKPNYSQSPQRAFRTATKFIIEQQQRLDFICLATGPRLLEDLPSWTPDFTVSGVKVPNPLKGNIGQLDRSLFSAAKDAPLTISFSDDCRVMNVEGLQAGIVEHLAPYWDSHRTTQGFEQALFEEAVLPWHDLFRATAATIVGHYGLTFSADLAMTKMLTADRVVDVHWNVSRFEPDRSFADLPQLPPEEYKNLGSPEEQFTIWQDARATMIRAALGHRVFAITGNGYIGLVPRSTQKGDVVCVLFGCDTPLVLRQVDDHYNLVGECYVHGLMDGELLESHLQGKTSSQTFEVR